MSWIQVACLCVSVLCVIIFCQWETKRRWRRLAQQGVVVTATSFDTSQVRRVVIIDFGYGKEVWMLMTDDFDVDRSERVFPGGVVLEQGSRIPHELENIVESVSIRF